MILVDAGPLVALVDADDEHHERCVEASKGFRKPLGTAWPPLTEAMYLLQDVVGAQRALWQIIARGAVRLLSLDMNDIPRISELMEKYADRQMGLADAALIRLAEREGVEKIFTIDRKDFAVYRIHGRVRPTILP